MVPKNWLRALNLNLCQSPTLPQTKLSTPPRAASPCPQRGSAVCQPHPATCDGTPCQVGRHYVANKPTCLASPRTRGSSVCGSAPCRHPVAPPTGAPTAFPTVTAALESQREPLRATSVQADHLPSCSPALCSPWPVAAVPPLHAAIAIALAESLHC